MPDYIAECITCQATETFHADAEPRDAWASAHEREHEGHRVALSTANDHDRP